MPLNTTLILAGAGILGAGGLLWWARKGGANSGPSDPNAALEEYCLQFPQDPSCEGTRARAAANAENSFAERQRARNEWDLGGSPPADPGDARANLVLQTLQSAMDVWSGPVGAPRSTSVGPKPALAFAPTWIWGTLPSNGMTARWNRLMKTIGMGQVMVKKANGHDWAVPGPDTSPLPRITGQLGTVQYNFPMRSRLLQDEGRRKWQQMGPGDREEAVLDWATYWRTVMPATWQDANSMPKVTTSYGTQVPAQVQYTQLSPPRYPPAPGGTYNMQPGGNVPGGPNGFVEALDFASWLSKWSPPPGVQQTIQESLAIAAKTGPLHTSTDPVVKKAVLTLPTAAGPRFMFGGSGMSPDDLDGLLGR